MPTSLNYICIIYGYTQYLLLITVYLFIFFSFRNRTGYSGFYFLLNFFFISFRFRLNLKINCIQSFQPIEQCKKPFDIASSGSLQGWLCKTRGWIQMLMRISAKLYMYTVFWQINVPWNDWIINVRILIIYF